MDKLKDFLKVAQIYQFWILLGLALLLPVWGWWSTTSDLVAQTNDRTKKIDASFGGLPKSGEKNPNDNWIDEVKKSNEKLDSGLKEAWQYLYQRQQQFKTWPKDLTERGFKDPDKASAFDLQRYNILYQKEVDEAWKIVNTVGGKPLENYGPVIFPKERMPRAAWANGVIPPTAEQMKAAQEDLWLLGSLLRSIQRVNGTAKTPLKAAVREIQTILLRGGTLGAAGAPAPAAPGLGGGGGRRGDDEGGMPGPAAATAAAVDTQAGFDPGEEMGPDPGQGGGGGRGGDGEGRGGAPQAAAPAASKRYLEELPQARKRGFYLQVVINQNKLPELLAQLSNSEWPVRILHVNMAERNPDSLVPPGDDNLPPAARIAAARGTAANDGPPAPGLDFGGRGPAANPAVGQLAGDEGRAAAMADPYLAVAAVSGYIVIYNPPPVSEAPAADAQGAPAAGNAAPAPAAIGAGGPPAGAPASAPGKSGTGETPATAAPKIDSKAGTSPAPAASKTTTVPATGPSTSPTSPVTTSPGPSKSGPTSTGPSPTGKAPPPTPPAAPPEKNAATAPAKK